MSRRVWRGLQLALSSFLTDKLRNILVLSAVTLAVSALTIIVATMEGAERKAEELAAKFGPTAVNVVGGDITGENLGRHSMTLTWNDVRALEAHLPAVERVSPYLYRLGLSVSGNGKTHAADALGGSPEDHGLHWSWPLERGRDFTPDDVRYARRVCFLGSLTAERLFGDRDPIGSIVSLDSIPFTVIGVHSKIGLAADGVEVDDRATVPITTMAALFNIPRERLFQIRVTFAPDTPEAAMPGHIEDVRAVLRASHGLTDGRADDFILFTARDILSFISILKGSVVLFLGVTVVAAIFISGFILANLFHVSVSQRQREIGLKKALGATKFDILLQFMFEALLLCTGGAVLGLLAGFCISRILQRFELLHIALSGFLFFAAFAGACGIGFIFALRPARTAANMPPVAALRNGP
ncbi:MAG: ABC transporter permease [Desulfovibrio sp.]|nr:ABC transporter permease [Desulfovibrio sp.]